MIGKRLTTAAALLGAAGCSAFAPCGSDDVSYRVTPTARAIAVGESFTAAAEFRGCGGGRRLEDEVRWAARDTAVAGVDAATGRVTGRAPGATVVEARGARYGLAPGIAVTVR